MKTSNIAKRVLGTNGPTVGAVGYGAMVLEGYYGKAEELAAERVLHSALDAGVNLIDTADAYGNGRNEAMIGRVIRERRDDAVVATKFGIVFEIDDSGTEISTGWGFSLRINGSPEYANLALERSLTRLGVDCIDIWYLHYPDPSVPIVETVAAMAAAVKAGKVRHIGMSNLTALQLREAHAVHPIACVQFEYSLWRREIEVDLMPTLRELGIGLVPWSPLGGGFLSGGITSLPPKDFRNRNPKYSAENLKKNIDRFAPLKSLAEELGITPAQLALAWILHQGPDVVPIPGTRTPSRVIENAAAAAVKLDAEMLRRIDEIAPPGAAAGGTLIP